MKTPAPDELGRAPHLAVLAALDAAAIHMAFLTLLKAYEEPRATEPVMEADPHAAAARRLVLCSRELGKLLDVYDDALRGSVVDPLDDGPLDGPSRDIAS